jgi:hypothetical protein
MVGAREQLALPWCVWAGGGEGWRLLHAVGESKDRYVVADQDLGTVTATW